MDPDGPPGSGSVIILYDPSTSKNRKKNLDFYFLGTLNKKDLDLEVYGTDPRIRYRTNMSRIHNTAKKISELASRPVKIKRKRRHIIPQNFKIQAVTLYWVSSKNPLSLYANQRQHFNHA